MHAGAAFVSLPREQFARRAHPGYNCMLPVAVVTVVMVLPAQPIKHIVSANEETTVNNCVARSSSTITEPALTHITYDDLILKQPRLKKTSLTAVGYIQQRSPGKQAAANKRSERRHRERAITRTKDQQACRSVN